MYAGGGVLGDALAVPLSDEDGDVTLEHCYNSRETLRGILLHRFIDHYASSFSPNLETLWSS